VTLRALELIFSGVLLGVHRHVRPLHCLEGAQLALKDGARIPRGDSGDGREVGGSSV